jgi:hypothetical protein
VAKGIQNEKPGDLWLVYRDSDPEGNWGVYRVTEDGRIALTDNYSGPKKDTAFSITAEWRNGPPGYTWEKISSG